MSKIEELKLNLSKAEGMLCGLVLSNPSILLEHSINNNLLSEDALLYIGIANRLLDKNIKVVDEVSFSSEIELLGLQSKYESSGGYQTIKELINIVDERNADSIFENWDKWVLIDSYMRMIFFICLKI